MKLNLNYVHEGFTAWISQQESKKNFDHTQAKKLSDKFQKIFSDNTPKKFPDFAEKLISWAEKKRKKKHFFSKRDVVHIYTVIQSLITRKKPETPALPVVVVPLLPQETEEMKQVNKLNLFVHEQAKYSEETIISLSILETDLDARMWMTFIEGFLPGLESTAKQKKLLLDVEARKERILSEYETLHNKTIPQLKHEYPAIHEESLLQKSIDFLKGQSDDVHKVAYALEARVLRFRQKLFPESSAPKSEEVPVHAQSSSPFRDIIDRYNLEALEKAVGPGAAHPSPQLANLIVKIKTAFHGNAPERVFDLVVMPKEQQEIDKNVREVRRICHPDKNPNNLAQAQALFQLCEEVKELLVSIYYTTPQKRTDIL